MVEWFCAGSQCMSRFYFRLSRSPSLRTHLLDDTSRMETIAQLETLVWQIHVEMDTSFDIILDGHWETREGP